MPNPSICDAPAVSVLIPTHNRRSLLPRSLTSLAGQSFRDFEVIVIDDGSDDGTAELVEDWATRAPFPLRYVHQARGGPARARNRGLALARGELIALLDSDDVYHRDKLAVQMEMMRSRSRPIFCYTGYRRMPDGRAFRSGAFDRGRYRDGNYLCCASVVMLRSAVVRIGGYDASLPMAEDWELLLRLSGLGAVRGTDEVLYEYHSHGGQISRNHSLMDRCTRRVRKKHGGRASGGVAYATLEQTANSESMRDEDTP